MPDNPIRIDIDGAGREYLPFAKKKLAALKDYIAASGIVTANKTFRVARPHRDKDEITIFIQSIPGMDLIRIRGGEPPVHIYLIYVPHTIDPHEEIDEKDYKVLVYLVTFKKGKPFELKPSAKEPKNLAIEDSGQNLVVQSARLESFAMLPSIYTFNSLIDVTDAMRRSWGAIDVLFGRMRYIGSTKADTHESDGKLGFSFTARRNYVTDDDGLQQGFLTPKVIARDFRWKYTHLSFTVRYDLLGVIPMDATLGRWGIFYRKVKDGEWFEGALIGEDYVVGTPMKNGYTWKEFSPIVAISPTKVLVRITENTLAAEPLGQPVTFKTSMTRNCEVATSHCGKVGEITGKGEATVHKIVQDERAVRTETLKLGELTIDTTTMTEERFWVDGFIWNPFSGFPALRPVPGYTCRGISAPCARSVSGSMTSSYPLFNQVVKIKMVTRYFPGGKDVWCEGPVAESVYVGSQTISRRNGERGIHVIAFDNLDEDSTFIIFYRKDQVTYEKSVIYGDDEISWYTPEVKNISSSQVIYNMVYRIKSGEIQRFTIGNGEDAVRAVSCQIHRNFMAYTYNVFDGNKFKWRIIGIIDMKTEQRKVFEMEKEDERLKGFNSSGLAAIGIF